MTTRKPTENSPSSKIEWINIGNFEALCFNMTRQFMTFDQPIPDFSTRSLGILESCLETPLQQFGGKDLYPTLTDKASILFYLLIKNHPFLNGNKRTALTALLVVMYINGFWIETSSIKIYQLAKSIAISDRRNKDNELITIREFLQRYMVKRKK